MHTYKLVDGTFSPSEANTVLMNLVNSKISFHHVQMLSKHETMNEDFAHSKKRIAELKEMKLKLKELIDQATKDEMFIQVEGNIQIKFTKKKRTARKQKTKKEQEATIAS